MKLKDLEHLTDEELLIKETNENLRNAGAFYRAELERRAILRKHELDLKLIDKQSAVTVRVALIGVAAALVSALIGAYATNMFQSEKQEKQQLQFQQRIEKEISELRHAQKDSTVPSRPPSK